LTDDGIWVFDVEADGLNPTKIYCLAAGCPLQGKVFVTSDYDKMRKFLLSAKVLIGHNIKRWDIVHLERILEIKITAKIVDTLGVSWYLYPDPSVRHGLDPWGEVLGIHKPKIDDWFNLSQEEYEHRCQEDVRINIALWNKMYAYLVALYTFDKDIWRLLDYLSFKLHCAMLQEKSRWKLDIEFTKKSLEELEGIQAEKVEALTAAMPTVPTIAIKTKPKVFVTKSGDYSKHGMAWIALLSEHGLPINYEGEISITTGYEPGNPNSPQQVKDWLDTLGWEPTTFKTTKNKKTGEEKTTAQINLEQGKGICPSIKRLYEKEPNLELLDGLSKLQHRIGILKGFLRDHEDGYLQAQVAGLTNTLRFKHTTIVNLPKPDKQYAASIRGALISDDDTELCGSDMSSLEDRIKQHFIFPYDPEYVKSMMADDFDPHLDLAVSASAITIEQMLRYKSGEDKSISSIRNIYKSGNYSLQYGTGIPKLAKTAGISREQAALVYKAYWEKNWAVKKVASVQTVKTVNDQMWLFNPVSKLWYSLRYEKDIFSTLVQGTASYVFDLWVEYILKEREQLTAQFHDEIVLTVKKGYSSFNTETKKWEGPIVDFLKNMIKKTNDELKLNRELDIDVQFGRAYAEIH
jgi:hypothetical protein